MRAYTPGVATGLGGARESAAAVGLPPSRRRRSATGAEQARRKEWDRKYGRLVSELTAQWRKEGN